MNCICETCSFLAHFVKWVSVVGITLIVVAIFIIVIKMIFSR